MHEHSFREVRLASVGLEVALSRPEPLNSLSSELQRFDPREVLVEPRLHRTRQELEQRNQAARFHGEIHVGNLTDEQSPGSEYPVDSCKGGSACRRPKVLVDAQECHDGKCSTAKGKVSAVRKNAIQIAEKLGPDPSKSTCRDDSPTKKPVKLTFYESVPRTDIQNRDRFFAKRLMCSATLTAKSTDRRSYRDGLPRKLGSDSRSLPICIHHSRFF